MKLKTATLFSRIAEDYYENLRTISFSHKSGDGGMPA